MKKQNEQNASKALIEILERMTGVRYECESCPDDGTSRRPEVDFILKSTRDGISRVAVELTLIESFPKQIENAIRLYEIAEEIRTRCWGKIPPDRYYILTGPPILISSFASKKKKIAFFDSLDSWIVQHAWQLKVDESLPYTYDGHNMTFTCGGTAPSLNGNVWSIPEQPIDLKTLQKDRFAIAIQHALKKLRRYKRTGFNTVMLLEDVAGINHQYLAEELAPLDKDQIEKCIDYIIVIESNQDRMIAGYVWKENLTWHSFIPYDRRFDLRSLP